MMLLYKLKCIILLFVYGLFSPILIVADYVLWNLFMTSVYDPVSFREAISSFKDAYRDIGR